MFQATVGGRALGSCEGRRSDGEAQTNLHSRTAIRAHVALMPSSKEWRRLGEEVERFVDIRDRLDVADGASSRLASHC